MMFEYEGEEMIERFGRLIGIAAANIAHFLRGRQAVPCTMDWDGPSKTRWGYQWDGSGYNYWEDDGCSGCDNDCCLTTDTLGEIRG